MAGAPHMKFKVSIPEEYTAFERELLGDEIIDFIRERVQGKNLDKRNRPFGSYSEEYVDSLDFKIAGKDKNEVNLTLSGDMLGAMRVLEHERGSVTIGYEDGSQENAKAAGNILGTYGKDRPVGPKRDFLGLTKQDLEKIVRKIPPGREETMLDAYAAHLSSKAVKKFSVEAEDVESSDEA